MITEDTQIKLLNILYKIVEHHYGHVLLLLVFLLLGIIIGVYEVIKFNSMYSGAVGMTLVVVVIFSLYLDYIHRENETN